MPNETKPFGRVKRAITGAVVIFGLTCGNAVAVEWPLEFPVETFKNIPGGQGMRFFYGVWKQLGTRPQGGPTRIKAGRIESGVPVHSVDRYRILHEAANYVLVVKRAEQHPLVDVNEIKYPTKFNIYTLQSFGFPTERNAELRLHSCGFGTWGTKGAFDWPVEKLLETFKTSMCFGQIEFDGSVSIGWGHDRLGRVPAK